MSLNLVKLHRLSGERASHMQEGKIQSADINEGDGYIALFIAAFHCQIEQAFQFR